MLIVGTACSVSYSEVKMNKNFSLDDYLRLGGSVFAPRRIQGRYRLRRHSGEPVVRRAW